MSVTHVDFIGRKVISKPTQKAPSQIIISDDMFSKYDYSVQCIQARFGNHIPSHAPTGIFLQDFKNNKFDAYGFGNTHNSMHQYSGPNTTWNRHTPFPADLRAINNFLRKRKGKTATLGFKSDAFQWMDDRYKVGKFTLELANKYNVKLTINTMSDLIAHRDYGDLIAQGGHTVVMQMGFKQELKGQSNARTLNNGDIERMVSPGAPSLLRRQAAINKLVELGVTVEISKTDFKKLTKMQLARFNKMVGFSVEKVV